MNSMYFVAVVLPKYLDEKVLAYKRWMEKNWDCKVGLKSPAHITLLPPFWMNEEKEAALVADVSQVAKATAPFRVCTANFFAFKPRTLFVAVKENTDLDVLKKRVDNRFRQADYKPKVDSRPFHPHITIATRDVTKMAFAEAWPQLESKTFEEEFEAEGLSLLKHNGKTWDVMHTAMFRSD